MAAVFLPATTSADLVKALLCHCGIPHHMHLSGNFFRMKDQRERDEKTEHPLVFSEVRMYKGVGNESVAFMLLLLPQSQGLSCAWKIRCNVR